PIRKTRGSSSGTFTSAFLGDGQSSKSSSTNGSRAERLRGCRYTLSSHFVADFVFPHRLEVCFTKGRQGVRQSRKTKFPTKFGDQAQDNLALCCFCPAIASDNFRALASVSISAGLLSARILTMRGNLSASPLLWRSLGWILSKAISRTVSGWTSK